MFLHSTLYLSLFIITLKYLAFQMELLTCETWNPLVNRTNKKITFSRNTKIEQKLKITLYEWVFTHM